jgi:hypothetical protein
MTAIFLWLQIVVQASAQPAPQSTFPFVANLEAALKESKDRKAPLLFCDFDGWSKNPALKGENRTLEQVLASKNLATAARKVVCVLGSQEKHGDSKQVIDGVERTVCQAYGWSPCSAHKAALDWVFRKFSQNGELKSPYFHLVGPDGDELVSFVGEPSGDTVAEAIERAVSGMPKYLDGAVYARCRTLMADAATAEKAVDYLTVRESWETIQTLAKGYPLTEQAQAELMRLNDLGRQRKNDLVSKIDQGDKRQNLFALDDLAFALGDLASAELTRSAVDELLAKPGFAEHKEELEKYREAREIYNKARRLAADGKKDQARRLLIDSTKRLASTPFESTAKKLLDELSQVRKPKKP